MRPSCENCPHTRLPRLGDITLGDFWGIYPCDKVPNDHHGISVVLMNSNKGQRAMEAIASCLQQYVFHGVCCAIILQKPFICFENGANGIERIHVLSLCGLTDRIVRDTSDPTVHEIRNASIDFLAVERRLEAIRDTSQESCVMIFDLTTTERHAWIHSLSKLWRRHSKDLN